MFSHYSKSMLPSSHKEAVVLPRGIQRLCQEAWEQDILTQARLAWAEEEKKVSDPYYQAIQAWYDFRWKHLKDQADKAWEKLQAWREKNPWPEGETFSEEAQGKRRQAQELAEILLEKESFIRFLL